MRIVSYESPYDKSVAYRIVLSYFREHCPELGVSRSQKMAWGVAESIQEQQVLPLLMNLSTVSQAFDLLGVPAAPRTDEHPDLIDQMSIRLPYLVDMAFPAGEDVILHELLDEATVSRNDANSRILTLPERLRTGVDDLLAWRALVSEQAEAAASNSDVPTALLATSPTKPLPLHEVIGALVDQMMPEVVIDPIITARVEEILSRLTALATDQDALRSQFNQLQRSVRGRLGDNQNLKAQMDRGLSVLASKIKLVDGSVAVVYRLNKRQHAENRRQTASLQQQLANLTRAVNKPRVDTAEILSQLAVITADQGTLSNQVNQLQRFLLNRLGNDLRLRQRIDRGFDEMRNKIGLIESTAKGDVRTLHRLIGLLEHQIAALKKAFDEPRVDIAERLLREALDGEHSRRVDQRTSGGATDRPPASPANSGGGAAARVPTAGSVAVLDRPVITVKPPTKVKRAKHPRTTLWKMTRIGVIADVILGVFFIAYVVLLFVPLASASSYPVNNPAAQFQERWAESHGNEADYISQSYRDDGEAYLRHTAMAAFDVWLRTPSHLNSYELSDSVNGLTNNKTVQITNGIIDMNYDFNKDATSVEIWREYMRQLDRAQDMNPKFDTALANKTALALEIWLRGYQPPSKRVGPQELCYTPRAIENLAAKHVPAVLVELFACPVRHYSPALSGQNDSPFSYARRVALFSPSTYWPQLCDRWASEQAIVDYHDQNSVPISEIKAHQCK